MTSSARKRAVWSIASQPFTVPELVKEDLIKEVYGKDVFSLSVMKEYLPKHSFLKLQHTIKDGMALDPAIADDVANAMKQWALKQGASHYTHWFLPLTGSTAEKHDSFVEPDGQGGIVMNFSGKNLIVGEPDASSFPSGGLRSTFEARGYTAWDPTSPAFIKRGRNGATLCIPTAFCSYTGEALDKKTPLLRSIQAVGRQISRILHCFGESVDAKPEVTLGTEQEYFLIDRNFYLARPDLIQTGRTLFGAPPPKHQQLDDHYYGTIKARILAFMTEVDQTLWRLGIPAKTRHNEVAPAQFEIAAVFEELNLASDHNMLTMDVLRQTADRHGFVCLMHEKPFDGVNGSGKHNNWSFGTTKMNFLSPGRSPEGGALFLTAICAVIQAVDRHGELLRMATASSGNSYRLGANEAPPSVISIYLGDELTRLIDELESGTPGEVRKGKAMQLFVDTLPPLPRDATDRNRTSPFAFTGNKFEFRAPGSSQSCSGPNTILNTIVAEAFDRMSDVLENLKKDEFNSGLQKHLQKVIRANKRIIFNGDGYTEEWLKEAEKRGLPNAKTTMEALRCLTAPENIAMLEKYGVYNRRELESRFEVFLEEYHRRIRIEGEIALEIAASMIAPVVTAEYGKAARALAAAKEAGLTTGLAALQKSAAGLGAGLDELNAKLDALRTALGGLHEEIIAAMAELRHTVDSLERLVADECWPLPKYREMLFVY